MTYRHTDCDDHEITAADIVAVQRLIALADLSELIPAQIRNATTPKRKLTSDLDTRETVTLAPGFRRVFCDGNIEREPRDGEPFTVVERDGDFERCMMPTFRSWHGLRLVKPRLLGPWDVTEFSDQAHDSEELESGETQGWAWWIRLARELRS